MIETLTRRLPAGLLPFLAVGTVGFSVDAVALAVLTHGAGLGPYIARVLSFAIAVSVTYALNRTWTFRARASQRRGPEYARYLGVQLVGVALNFAVYAAAIESMAFFGRYPVLALAAGSAVAMVWNYLGARLFTFRG